MVLDDFSFETPSTAVEASAHWDLAAGSSSGLTFAGTVGSITVGCGTGNFRVLNVSAPPSSIHQLGELSFKYATNSSGTIRCGVLLRHVDASNYVVLRANQTGTKVAEVVEVVAGVATTLLTVPYVGPATGYGAIRLELIGRRARVWYESAAKAVHDRPPDGAVDLSKDYDTNTAYGWGMYAESSATTDLAITHFTASGLPSFTLPPPYTLVFTAAGFNFTAVTLTANNLGTATQVEWQVCPVDIADFPEPYCAITSAASYVVFVRTGYTYDARARALNGDPGPWTPWARIGPFGSPGGSNWDRKDWRTTNWPSLEYSSTGDTSIKLAPDNFPSGINPDWVLEGTDTGSSLTATGVSGVDKLTNHESRVRRTFKLGFANRASAQYQLLIKFFDFMRGKEKPFNWTHPLTGEVFVLRFDSDDYDAKYNARNLTSPILSVEFSTVESPVSVIPTYAFRLLADSTL